MSDTQTLYKVLVNGKSCHGGDMLWPLPNGVPRGWVKFEGKPKICASGIHLTNKYESWLKVGCTIYEAEAENISEWENDKCVCTAARLIKEVPKPNWWLLAEKFIQEEIPSVPWFKNNGEILVKHKKYAASDAARDAASDAAWNAAWNAAWYAARYAALHCLMLSVCSDLNIVAEHRQNAAVFWSIWKAGYGCAGKIGDEYIVYEKP